MLAHRRAYVLGIAIVCSCVLAALPLFLNKTLLFNSNASAALPNESQPKGRETGMPLPRFASFKSNKTHVRAGPGEEWGVSWVYQKKSLPIQIIDEYDHWRKICDHEGATGWVHKNLLTGQRSVLVLQDAQNIYRQPQVNSAVVASTSKGVVLPLRHCQNGWCYIASHDIKGWLPQQSIWGTAPEDTGS